MRTDPALRLRVPIPSEQRCEGSLAAAYLAEDRAPAAPRGEQPESGRHGRLAGPALASHDHEPPVERRRHRGMILPRPPWPEPGRRSAAGVPAVAGIVDPAGHEPRLGRAQTRSPRLTRSRAARPGAVRIRATRRRAGRCPCRPLRPEPSPGRRRSRDPRPVTSAQATRALPGAGAHTAPADAHELGVCGDHPDSVVSVVDRGNDADEAQRCADVPGTLCCGIERALGRG